MEYIRLGKSDLLISRLGFGCWAIGGHGYGDVDDKESILAIQTAVDLGINFFDTADVYGFGRSEEILSKALGSHIKSMVVATKFGVSWDRDGRTFKDCSPQRAVTALEGSLRRLKLDCIPLYQIHWYDNRTGLDDLMNMLIKCQQSGKIKLIGCSNFSCDLVSEALSVGRMESFQCEYNLLHQSNRVDMKKCFSQYELSVFAYRVLGRGLFTGKYNRDISFSPNDTRRDDEGFKGSQLDEGLKMLQAIKMMAYRLNQSPAQVAIRWVLSTPFVSAALVGAKTALQVRENVGALGWSMPKDVYILLKESCSHPVIE